MNKKGVLPLIPILIVIGAIILFITGGIFFASLMDFINSLGIFKWIILIIIIYLVLRPILKRLPIIGGLGLP